MRQTLFASVGVLALMAGPALAQQGADPAAPQPQAERDAGMTKKAAPGVSTDAPRADNPVRQQAQAAGGSENKDGPIRDAVGDPPVAPSPMGQRQAQAENAPQGGWGEEIPFPPQDVSDSDIETFGARDVPYPGEFPDRSSPRDRTASVGDDRDTVQEGDVVQEGDQVPTDIERIQQAERWNDAILPGDDQDMGALDRRGGDRSGGSADGGASRDQPAGVGSNEDVVREGEQLPADIERYQQAERWNDAQLPSTDGGSAILPDRGNVPGPDMRSAERGPASAWDGRGVGRAFDRGRLNPERSPSTDEAAGRQADGAAAEQDLSADDPRLALARTALATARTIAPEISFSTYRFEVEDRERLIEIAGQDPENGRRIEVDVYPDGRIESVAQQVPLSAVPVKVQALVSMGIPGFQPARALRAIGRDLELQYEIDGYSADDRPISVRVEPNGAAMLVTVWNG
ncbi:MAG TPA: hypothetical protein VGN97_08080 [Mesorhizobium sp.]|nr:hypothetical protein [Mesorhizobium sp.]